VVKSYPVQELRSAVRFPLKLRATIKSGGVEEVAETENISSGGVLFHLQAARELGTPVEFTLELPSEVLGARHAVAVRCLGRVMRCAAEDKGYAVAVVIDEYRFGQSTTAGEQEAK